MMIAAGLSGVHVESSVKEDKRGELGLLLELHKKQFTVAEIWEVLCRDSHRNIL